MYRSITDPEHGSDEPKLVEVPSYGREIKPEERQTLLPLEERVAITGNAADGHSVTVGGKKLEGAFGWGKKVTPPMLELAEAILATVAKSEDAAGFSSDFAREFLCANKTSEDFAFELDIGKWVTWKKANPNQD